MSALQTEAVVRFFAFIGAAFSYMQKRSIGNSADFAKAAVCLV
jgi:hypothetical protein